jgi:hypothetical protein
VVVEDGGSNEQGVMQPASAYLLNTAANKFVGTIFTSAFALTIFQTKSHA